MVPVFFIRHIAVKRQMRTKPMTFHRTATKTLIKESYYPNLIEF